jgi:tetratricopeptide (TPR) repeat protein
LILAAIAVAGLTYCYYATQRQRRACHIHLDFEHALQRRDFVRAHALIVDYLRIYPGDAAVHLQAAQAARRAQFQETFVGPQTDVLNDAGRHLDDCSRLHGPEEPVALERSLLRVQQGELEGLEGTLFSYAETGNPDVPLVLEALIHGYLRRLNLDKARYCIEKLLTLEPDNVQALVWRGQLKEQFQNFPSAQEDYEQAVRLNPDFDSARISLVGHLMRSNRAEEAAEHLAVLEQRLPQNPLVRLALALCQVARGDTQTGRALLDDWLMKTPSTHPRRVEALTARANVSLTLEQPMEAEHYARQALRISPLDRNALHSLYRSLVAQGQDQEAKKVQTQLDRIKKDMEFVSEASTQIGQTPNDVLLRHRLGEAYARLGRSSEALIWFLSVLDRDPGYRPTLKALVEYYEHSGEDAKAAEYRQRLAAANNKG